MLESKKKHNDNLLVTVGCVDTYLTEKLAVCANDKSPCANLRPLIWLVELSGTGYISISTSLLLLVFSSSIYVQHIVINILLGIAIDLVIVGILKGITRRERPQLHDHGDMVGCYSVDKFSFPSGHASRVVMLTFILLEQCLSAAPPHLKVLLLVYCSLICISRLALGRHHVSDVGAGMLLGYVEYLLLLQIWLSPAACDAVLQYMHLL